MSGSLHSRQHSLSHHPSINTHATGYTPQTRHASRSTKNRGFGGFPMPYTMVTGLFDRVFPNIRKKLSRTVTIPHTTSYIPTHENAPPGTKSAPYISFRAIVGRNSAFHELTHEQMEELGGVEYRALNALLWIVGGVRLFIPSVFKQSLNISLVPYCYSTCVFYCHCTLHINQQMEGRIFTTPANTTCPYLMVCDPPPLFPTHPNKFVRFSLFQSTSAYSNTGFSLVDQSMVPFQTAYPMIFFMAFLILAGNTAFVSCNISNTFLY